MDKQTDQKEINCCICNKKVEGYGHNPSTLYNKGKCCTICNFTQVIPARLILNKK